MHHDEQLLNSASNDFPTFVEIIADVLQLCISRFLRQRILCSLCVRHHDTEWINFRYPGALSSRSTHARRPTDSVRSRDLCVLDTDKIVNVRGCGLVVV